MHGTVCYLYYFTCGSYLGWVFWPNHPLFGYSWIQCFLGRKLPEGPSGVCGIRYSIMRIFGVDWLCRGSELLWWRDICNVGYGGRRWPCFREGVWVMHAGWPVFGWVNGRKTWSKRPQGFTGGRILGRVSGVVHAAGMTLVEYTAAGLGVSGHQALLGGVY